MNQRLVKADEAVSRAKALAELMEDQLYGLYPEEGQVKQLERIQALSSVLTEAISDLQKIIYELEYDSRIVDVFLAVKEARE